MKTLLILLVVAGWLLVTASAADQPAKPAGGDATAVVHGNNSFALDLYHKLRDRDGNQSCSPYSISSALAMTYAGARGETAAQMAKTLHFRLPTDQLHATFATLIRDLNGPSSRRKYQLYVANALWGQRGYRFRPDFLELTQRDYGAGLRDVDFAKATEEARQTINRWVEQQTQDKIKDLLAQGTVAPDTRLVLTNAVYFKAAWENPFNKRATKREEFTLAGGQKAPCDLMHQVHLFRHHDAGSFQVLDLPYDDNDLSMIILLPKAADGLAAVEKSLSADRLADFKQSKHERVAVTLPKFKFTAACELSGQLAALGMPIAFDAKRADFSGMVDGPEPLFINQVIHKAFVDVHEEGTEAAAATAVAMRAGSAARPAEPIPFKADHPFLFAIRHNGTGSLLFLGRLSDPTKSE